MAEGSATWPSAASSSGGQLDEDADVGGRASLEVVGAHQAHPGLPASPDVWSLHHHSAQLPAVHGPYSKISRALEGSRAKPESQVSLHLL